MTEAPSWHGYAGNPSWDAPKCITKTNVTARPNYSDVDASEYCDVKDVLSEKVDLLVQMIKASKAMIVYTGAGLSTAAGIGDYASKAKSSIIKPKDNQNRLHLEPTKSHRVLAALEKAGHLKHWVQQNHDGLAQKAGFPYAKINEIHGGWFDKNNPVVLMDGTLKPDLWKLCQEWAAACDLNIAMGTSLCGMGADCCFTDCCRRHMTTGSGLGGVVINLQRTPHDANCALRIFASLDTVWTMVAKRMKLKLDTETFSPYPPVDRKERRKLSPPSA